MAKGCPKCRFPGASILQDGSCRCANCGHVYQARIPYPQPPARRGAASSSTNSPRTAIIIVVSIIVLAVSGFIFAVSASESDRPEPPEPAPTVQASTSESAPRNAVPAGPPRARIDAPTLKGKSGTRRWWVVHYHNTGKTTIYRPSIKVSYTDTRGRKATWVAASLLHWLPRGADTWIKVQLSNVGQGAVRFEVTGLKSPGKYQTPWARMQGRNLSVEENPSSGAKDYPYLKGEVYNDSHFKLFSIRVFAVGYDENDQPCSFATGYTTKSILADRDRAGFKVRTGDWQTRKPSYWRVEAWGMVRD
jgi:hypothetical protein